MTINTQMSPQEVSQLNYRVDGFNAKLKEDQKIVSKNSLGEADFMTLLITQLKSQDPTKPMDDKEFIGQMAQFTSLKQMNQLSDSMKDMGREYSFTRAVGLVNKTVTWKNEVGQINTGLVDSVKVKNGETYLSIDGQEVGLSTLLEVRDPMGMPSAAVNQGFIQAAPVPAQQKEGITSAAQALVGQKAAESYSAYESAGYNDTLAGESVRGLPVAAQTY